MDVKELRVLQLLKLLAPPPQQEFDGAEVLGLDGRGLPAKGPEDVRAKVSLCLLAQGGQWCRW